ncbi:hypothetical protein [Curtobacterium oceanosedimentum]|uniref:hypothetical protein n=1 Tax=Curtobacterium oceanosedimentum TaxID=465820 RepID=UPI001CE16821|nr:hypothetical protein [Curtobacterium oceanosedimentum]
MALGVRHARLSADGHGRERDSPYHFCACIGTEIRPRLASDACPNGGGHPMSQSCAELPHAAELGAFVGNSKPDWSRLPGIHRQPKEMFGYGNIETSSRVESCSDGYRLVDRDRAYESTAAEFSHVDDVERFIAIRDGSQRSSGPWFPGRATAPDAVTLQADGGGTYVFSWGHDDVHIVRAFGIPAASAAYRLAWVRALPLEQVIDIVSAPWPMEWLAAHGMHTQCRLGTPDAQE